MPSTSSRASLHSMQCEDIIGLSENFRLLHSLKGTRLLITGGTGFFGSWLLSLLAVLNEQDWGVSVTVVSRNPSAFLLVNSAFSDCKWLSWIRADIEGLVYRGQKFDLVIHAASETSASSHSHPIKLFDSLFLGARQLLSFAAAAGVRRVLLTGSGAQYGTLSQHAPVTENSSTACDSTCVSSSYAEGKRAQETLAAGFSGCYGFDVIYTRCFAFSGAGLPVDGHFAIGNFVRDALSREAINVESDGSAVRSYLHGADLSIWLLRLLISGAAGQAYNVGSDYEISIAELANRAGKCLAPTKAVRILGGSSNVPGNYYVPNINRSKGLGLCVWTSLDDSIRSIARYAGGVAC